MNPKIKFLLHDINRCRDQINCCYTCITQDLKAGDHPQSDDLQDLKKAADELSQLVAMFSEELKGTHHETNQ